MIISARFVKKPRKVHRCDGGQCTEYNNRSILREHIAVYGAAERGDPPYTLRFCIPCVKGSVAYDAPHRDHKKLKAALEKAA